MEKIVLRSITLVNWYGFAKTTIPLADDLTFITGENESGKSTILDAFKYAYLGDISFNRSSGSSARTVSSYTRCLIDSSINLYARPADRFPTVYTHIALEFYDKLNDVNKILGVIIETSSSNETTARRYIIKNKKIADISFTYEKDGKEIPYGISDFRNTYNVELFDVEEGKERFSRETGLRLNRKAISNYCRHLRSMMTYKPESKIADFMKRYVLEEKEVDLSKLKKTKQNIDVIKNDLNNIESELAKLKKILDFYHEYSLTTKRLLLDRVREILISKKEAESLLTEYKSEEERLKREIDNCEQNLKINKKESDEADNELIDAKTQLNANNAGKAVEDEKKKYIELCEKEAVLSEKASRLHGFQEIADNIIRKYPCDADNENTIISNLEKGDFSDADKETAVGNLKKQLNKKRDTNIEQITLLRKQLDDNNKKEKEYEERIENLKKGRIDFASHPKQQDLISAINEEFAKRKIQSEAKMAFEYVLDVKDKDWQKAIESFLNIHRYAVIVEPEYFSIANTIMDGLKITGVELVRTKALQEMKLEVYDDAVSNKLDIQNEIAAKYFAYWLGKIHAVENKEVDKFDNALSKEGKLSRNLAVSYIDLNKLKEYCLGLDAAKKTIDLFTAEKEELVKEDHEIHKKKEQLKEENNILERYLDSFGEYDYSSAIKLQKTKAEVIEKKKNIETLEESLRNNNEYMMLAERVSKAEERVKKLKEVHEKLESSRIKNSEKRVSNEANINKQKDILRDCSDSLSMINKDNIDASQIIDDCEKKTVEELKNETRIVETRKRDISRQEQLKGNIPAAQAEYNLGKRNEDRLPTGVEYEAEYQNRYKRMQIDDFAGVDKKLREQMGQFEKVFKKEFCILIHKHVKESIDETKEISKELRSLNFTTKYDLNISKITDNSDFDKILRYGEYLAKIDDSKEGTNLFGLSEYSEEEIKSLESEVVSIIEDVITDNDERRMNELSDYRNYLTYEVIINGDGIVNGKLSKQIGYASGAATQIPYLLILSAALSMFYRSRENCSRIVFIDEPFDKMSDDNIKQMLDFFKNQNFQAILCAPTNRMDSIGEECDCIVPVIKRSKEQMTVGKERWKDA